MRKIYKYPLNWGLGGKCKIQAHHDITYLSAQLQNADICIWAEVDTDNFIKEYEVEIIGTGQHAPQNKKYLDTVQVGEYVWHVYVETGHEIGRMARR